MKGVPLITKNVTIIVPCFNEEKRWNKTYWINLITKTDLNWFFVNDGSSDCTSEVLAELSIYPQVTVFELRQNGGKAEAIRFGMLRALERPGINAIGFLDADAAFSYEAFLNVLDTYNGLNQDHFESLWASRVALSGREINRNPRRHYIGRVISTFLGFRRDLPYDTQCGFKIFTRTKNLELCLSKPFRTRWFFDIEIYSRLHVLNAHGMGVWEHPLLDWDEVAESHINVREILRILKEMYVINKILTKNRSL
jgi:glycosyltransferase involved in cell wall biosynthesis